MNKLGYILFRYRSYTPIPLLVLMLYYFNGSVETFFVGTLILFLGEIIRFWGVSYVGEITRNTIKLKTYKLVTQGPYAYVRNPLYIGNIIIYLGFGIFSNSLFPYLQLSTIVWFILQYSLIVLVEEDYLEKSFGEKYRIYKKAVPKFFPRLRPFRFDDVEKISPSISIALKSESRTFQAFVSLGIISILIYFIK